MTKNFDAQAFIANVTQEIQTQLAGGKKALCGLSGGVDSVVAAALVHNAVPGALTCVYVDTGLMRTGETDEVESVFRQQFNAPLVRVDAQDHFLQLLQGVTDPEQKRKIIGEAFVRMFEAQKEALAQEHGKIHGLVQGTIYPDILESQSGDFVKSHHNVGGLPEDMDFELVEPLRTLYKDEVRAVGQALGLPDSMVFRQPFPGPGLAVRCIGEITREKLDILRAADLIVRQELDGMGIWQYFAVLTDMRSVGVREGKRAYGYVAAVRAVSSVDAMTANWFPIPHEKLEVLSQRITAEVPDICRLVYDITNKPVGTIEWE